MSCARLPTRKSGQEEGVRIANFLCNGNYAVSGGLPGCEVGCLMLLPGLWEQLLSSIWRSVSHVYFPPMLCQASATAISTAIQGSEGFGVTSAKL